MVFFVRLIFFFGNAFIQLFQQENSGQILIITAPCGSYPVSGNAEISKTIYGSVWYWNVLSCKCLGSVFSWEEGGGGEVLTERVISIE